MKKFVAFSDLKLQKMEMQNIVGGDAEVIVRYAVPLYGIKPGPVLRYGIAPLYGILVRYGISVDTAVKDES